MRSSPTFLLQERDGEKSGPALRVSSVRATVGGEMATALRTYPRLPQDFEELEYGQLYGGLGVALSLLRGQVRESRAPKGRQSFDDHFGGFLLA